MQFSRRQLIGMAAACSALPQTTFANTPTEITWDDLIPPGIPYSEIIGEGEMDEINGVWKPIFDDNATKLNTSLNGAYIKIPGFIIPIDLTAKGIKSFVLVPYIGACIHVPTPPPNQLVFVTTEIPWPSDKLWDAVWVTGVLKGQSKATDIADTGYSLSADTVSVYEW